MSVPDAWENTVKSQVKPLVRALYSAGSFVGNRGDTWLFSVPNEAHGNKCNEFRADVEAALTRAVGSPVTIEFVSGGGAVGDEPRPAPSRPAPSRPAPSRPEPEPAARESAAPSAPPASAPANADPAPTTTRPDPVPESDVEPEPYVPEADEDVDLHELTDAPPESVKTPIDRLAEAFPGSELMADD